MRSNALWSILRRPDRASLLLHALFGACLSASWALPVAGFAGSLWAVGEGHPVVSAETAPHFLSAFAMTSGFLLTCLALVASWPAATAERLRSTGLYHLLHRSLAFWAFGSMFAGFASAILPAFAGSASAETFVNIVAGAVAGGLVRTTMLMATAVEALLKSSSPR